MDRQYQELIAALSCQGQQNHVLTVLLSGEDPEAWEHNKHLIVSNMPFLTLEMAVNRVCQREHNTVPDPDQILRALNYARDKQAHYASASQTTKIAS